MKKRIVSILALAFFIWLGVSLYLETDRVGDALKSKHYENVQLVITTETTAVSEDEEGEQVETVNEDIIELTKDGTTYYEKSDANEYYQYERDGELFLLYYDDFYGMKTDDGNWVEVSVKEEDSPIAFDFSLLDDYEKSDFQKVDDYYAVKEHMAELFADIMKIEDDSKYYGYDMKFYFSKGKLSKILISYDYAMETDVVRIYEFFYENDAITVPEADVKYGETTE